MTTLTLPKKPQEQPNNLRFIERKKRDGKQRARCILQELVKEDDQLRWRDVPLVQE